ncbi:MAG: response regulator [Bacteroidales bacterium]
MQNHSVRIEEAEDGTSGIERCKALKPDLVLMDIRMPDISGIDAMHALREHPDTGAIPIVAVTASVHLSKKEMALEKGFNNVLYKPFKKWELFSILREYLAYETLDPLPKEPVRTKAMELEELVLDREVSLQFRSAFGNLIGSLGERKSMSSMKSLAEALVACGTSFSVEPLVLLGQDLEMCLSSFNIPEIEKITRKVIRFYNKQLTES